MGGWSRLAVSQYLLFHRGCGMEGFGGSGKDKRLQALPELLLGWTSRCIATAQAACLPMWRGDSAADTGSQPGRYFWGGATEGGSHLSHQSNLRQSCKRGGKKREKEKKKKTIRVAGMH